MLQSFVFFDDVVGETVLVRMHPETKKMHKLTTSGLVPLEELPQPHAFLAEDYLANNQVTAELIDLDDEFSSFMNRDRIKLLDQVNEHAARLNSDELAALVRQLIVGNDANDAA